MPAGPAELRALYRAFQREGRRFPNYNVREFILRRSKEVFSSPASKEEAAQKAAVTALKDELAVVKRQSVIYGFYGRKTRNVMEIDLKLKAKTKA